MIILFSYYFMTLCTFLKSKYPPKIYFASFWGFIYWSEARSHTSPPPPLGDEHL
jgi:hypothetical protein